jgi:NADP-reducing hydrogenase subunit HndB
VAKLKISDLNAIKERVKRETTLREGQATARVTVHMGTCGIAAGARDIMTALMDEVEKENITDVIITTSGCAGLCSQEPMATVELAGKPPVKYVDLTEDKIRKIVKEHVVGGKIVEEYALAIGSEQAG